MATAPTFANIHPIDKISFKLHIAVDFGTDGLGLAYAIQDKVFVHSKWNTDKYRDVVKPKTIILLDNHGKVQQFGSDAKEVYMKLACKKDMMLFERFKMSLYDDQTITHDSNPTDDEKNKDKLDIKTQLIAANGTIHPAESVFIEAFKYVDQEAKRFLRKQKIKANKHEIQWIITVPAIWSDAAKHKMKQWIIKSGLVDANIPYQCKIVYEPDCASLAIQHEIANTRIRQQNNTPHSNDDSKYNANMMNAKFAEGEKYILIDSGGGTVDIACHEILGTFGVKEILPPSGGPWGSCYIDDQYEHTLHQIFGEKLMKEFKTTHPGVYMQIIHNFQRAKTDFYAQKQQHHNCRLPGDFIAWMEDKFDDDDTFDVERFVGKSVMGQSHLVTLNDEMLELDNVVWTSIFDQVIDHIIAHIKKLLDNAKLMRNCCYLCLCGGLSCSPYFKYKMELHFGMNSLYKLQLIIPERPILCVVQGAAYFGITENYIKARRLRVTYGVSKSWSLSRARSNGVSKEWIAKYTDSNNRVHGCFGIVAQKNTEIHTNQILSVIGTALSKVSVINIIYSDDEDPKTVGDAKRLATMRIDNGDDWKGTSITIEYHFYDTIFKVYAYPTNKPEQREYVDLIYQS